jgi:D-threonate/D-erythronate kinase
LADDLTGAASVAACLGEAGAVGAVSFDATDALDDRAGGKGAGFSSRAVVVDLAMRDANTTVIKERITAALAAARPDSLISFRVDSTGLSPIGTYLAAAFERLGNECRAVVMPVHPGAGRSYIGGELALTGEGESRPLRIEGEDYAVIELDSVRSEDLGAVMVAAFVAGSRIVVVEGSSESDVGRVAQAIISLKGPVVVVDPGPLTVALYLLMHRKSRVLAIVGSTSELSARQVAHARERAGAVVCELDVERALEDESVREGVVVDTIGQLEADRMVCVVTSGEVGRPQRAEVSAILGETAAAVMKRTRVDALYLSGGHVATAVCNALGAGGLRDLKEIDVLASYGRLDGGATAGLPVALKGGQVGDDSTMTRMLERLSWLAVRDSSAANEVSEIQPQ